MSRPVSDTRRSVVMQLAELVYELLDAHSDTACLAAELRSDSRWSAQLEYLRALQRLSRDVLAHPPLPQST
jgi:hypothetical protein